MSNFEEQSRFPETGRMVMPGDSVIGGPNAPINLTFRVLFDRTRWLKNTLAEYKAAADRTDTQKADKTIQLTAGAGLTGGGTLAGNRTFALGTPSKITATSTNAAVSNTHSHEIDKASPSVAGIVRTNNTLTGTSDSEALSAAMGKKLNDEKLGNRGNQTIEGGMLTVGRADVWGKLGMLSGQGKWIFEAHPSAADAVADSIRFNFKFEEPGKKIRTLRFHTIGPDGETVAYQSWVAAKAAEAAAGKADTKKLTDEDLNSITTPGLYGQALNVHATTERNYPVQKAGSLLSLPSAYNSDTDMASHQIYIPFDTDEIWRRGKRNGGRWTEWAKITVSPTELEEAVRTAAGQAVLLTGAQTARGVKTFSDGLKTTTAAATSNDTSVATTEFVQRAVGQAVLLTGAQTVRGAKTFSDGLKTATPAATSNDTSVATTEFVRQAVDSSVPSGAVMHFAMQTAPAGWLKADGSAVSRTQYPALFAAIGTTFGAGNGKTTFNLPDLRGEFVRGWDGGRDIDPGRAFGSAQGDAIRNITGSIDTGINSGHQLFDEATATGALAISKRQWRTWTSDTQDGRNNPTAFDFDASRVVPTAAENRPRNIALLACIKI